MDSTADLFRRHAILGLDQKVRGEIWLSAEEFGRAVDRSKHIRCDKESEHSLRVADDTSAIVTNFANVADLWVRQFGSITLIDNDCVGAAQRVGRRQSGHRRAEQRGRIASDYQYILISAVG